MSGVHRQPQGGISGGETGVESIVLNKGYEDDEDLGDVIVYTGDGGQDSNTQKQIEDQQWERRNRGLQINCDRGIPVRVLRGEKEELGSESGYRFDGLYRVESYWRELGKSGFQVCRFKLVKDPMEVALPEAEEPLGTEAPSRRDVTTQRIIRSSRVVNSVKKKHDFRCQACAVLIQTQGGPYAEGAHIKPLGGPHNGPDVLSNVLCLCPTCHVLFDKGAFVVGDSLDIEDLTGTTLGGRKLLVSKGHVVSKDHLAYHRRLWNK